MLMFSILIQHLFKHQTRKYYTVKFDINLIHTFIRVSKLISKKSEYTNKRQTFLSLTLYFIYLKREYI